MTSASSFCVTCGIITQLRASTGPLIFWMRVSATRSIGPNFAKSTFGHGGRFNPTPPAVPAGAAPRAAAGDAIAVFTKAWTSSRVMRPFGPLPRTWLNPTPSSRANRRIAGEAWTGAPVAVCRRRTVRRGTVRAVTLRQAQGDIRVRCWARRGRLTLRSHRRPPPPHRWDRNSELPLRTVRVMRMASRWGRASSPMRRPHRP